MSGVHVPWTDIADLLVDPVDRTPLRRVEGGRALAGGADRRYPVIDGQPMLLAPDGRAAGGWSFPPIAVADHAEIRAEPSPVRRLVAALKRRLRSSDGDPRTPLVADHVRRVRPDRDPLVLVVGGGSIGHGVRELAEGRGIRIVSFDVYPSAATTFVGDAHQIPLADGAVDGVWIQAVLEHVAQPHLVVGEIERVLAPGGVLYAETPFLQPVHEGPFDFHRFSESGHRLLFPGFDEVAAGPMGGPGAMAALAVRGLVGGLTRSQSVARVAYIASSWLSLVDRAVPLPWRSDFATGVYFLGTRSDQTAPRPFDAVDTYRGAQ